MKVKHSSVTLSSFGVHKFSSMQFHSAMYLNQGPPNVWITKTAPY